jgi:uncharacterized protein YndB with AHSA1/START domain
MPTVAASRTIAASPDAVWEMVGDPHHLPRWWPRVERVEGVEDQTFTEVLAGKNGKTVRADFALVEEVPERRLLWAQQLEGTPFSRMLRSAETEIALTERVDGGAEAVTEVTIELRQELRGILPRLGARLIKRAASATIEEALEGLERVFGDGD